jgi:hypothetical protein
VKRFVLRYLFYRALKVLRGFKELKVPREFKG